MQEDASTDTCFSPSEKQIEKHECTTASTCGLTQRVAGKLLPRSRGTAGPRRRRRRSLPAQRARRPPPPPPGHPWTTRSPRAALRSSSTDDAEACGRGAPHHRQQVTLGGHDARHLPVTGRRSSRADEAKARELDSYSGERAGGGGGRRRRDEARHGYYSLLLACVVVCCKG